MEFEASNFFQQANIDLFIKIILLVMVGLYAIFTLMLVNKVRSFNKILFLPVRSGGNLMETISIIYSIFVFIFLIVAFFVL